MHVRKLPNSPIAQRLIAIFLDDSEAASWTLLEIGIAITTVCLPSMGPLLSAFNWRRRHFEGGFSRVVIGSVSRSGFWKGKAVRTNNTSITAMSDNSKRRHFNGGIYSSANATGAEAELDDEQSATKPLDIPVNAIHIQREVDVSNLA